MLSPRPTLNLVLFSGGSTFLLNTPNYTYELAGV